MLPRYTLPTRPDYGNNVSVHDPSIFKDDDGTYYTFGSHFAVASSTNLMRWTQYASDNQAHRLYGGTSNANSPWRTVLADAFAHVGNGSDGNPPGSTWAPDVIKINGMYYMYYSLSTWGSNRSYIGRVEANSVTGPYSNSVEVLRTPAVGATGSAPNGIDPAIFYDKDGKLWMSYGSFFNGIYILEMETSGARIGLPKAGQGNYGKRIWNGNNGPEGPYIFYNASTDYYYLMVTHGSLSSDYNMRVARSRNPDGPYLDIRNRDVTNTNAAGNKLAGNYRFAGASRGYAALGHNSVLVENGRYFNIYHSRYLSGTDGVSGNHNQFVNQLFFNSDGWPVMAPNRYAGESVGCVEAESVLGEYDVVVHTPVGNSVTFVNSVVYAFTANGEIRQGNAVVGSWSRTGDYYFVVRINNVAYNGVMVPQYNIDLNYAELSFTGVSDQGNSIWANRKPMAR
ncbi:MAG: glycoside hydrolase family 43 protein [Fibromonadaceae bacterium]|jgi:arabinan endo-1,5-alpha-L-arabinosidase|nr:glycoside hydrolase family 43 protein [Fibromonadaceae bacterium]